MEEDTTRNPGSEKLLAVNSELVIFTVLEVAYRNSGLAISVIPLVSIE